MSSNVAYLCTSNIKDHLSHAGQVYYLMYVTLNRSEILLAVLSGAEVGVVIGFGYLDDVGGVEVYYASYEEEALMFKYSLLTFSLTCTNPLCTAVSQLRPCLETLQIYPRPSPFSIELSLGTVSKLVFEIRSSPQLCFSRIFGEQI